MATHLSKAQQEWLDKYENQSGFEPMSVHEFENGDISFDLLVHRNMRWLEEHQNEVYRACEKPVAGMFDDENV